MHIGGSDSNKPFIILQFLIPTFFGMIMMMLYIYSRNALLIGIIHGIYNFIIGLNNYIFEIEFTTNDDITTTYFIQLTINIIITLILFCILRKKFYILNVKNSVSNI